MAFDPAIDRANTDDRDLASRRIVWFDAFVMNVDRTARTRTCCSGTTGLWLIDHGAALYFQHNWPTAAEVVVSPFPLIRDHVLLPRASRIAEADAAAAVKLTASEIERICALIPDAWLAEPGGVRCAGGPARGLCRGIGNTAREPREVR